MSLPPQRGRLLLAAAILAALVAGASASQCRQESDAAQSWCGLPLEASNFQGHYKCDKGLLLGRPRDYDQLSSMVRRYSKVKAAGVGHSWWAEQLCAGGGGGGAGGNGGGNATSAAAPAALQVVTTEFDATRRA